MELTGNRTIAAGRPAPYREREAAASGGRGALRLHCDKPIFFSSLDVNNLLGILASDKNG